MGKDDGEREDNPTAGVGGGEEGPTRRVGPAVSAAPDDTGQLWSWIADSGKHQVRILSVKTMPFDLCEKEQDKKKGTHFAKSPTTAPSNDEILETMRNSVGGDIFTAVLHTVFDRSAKAIGLSSVENPKKPFVRLSEMWAALRKGGTPAAVVLCGCDSAQFADALVEQAGVPVAIGVGIPDQGAAELGIVVTVNLIDCVNAADAATASLMRGDKISRAVQLGKIAMTTKLNDSSVVAVGKYRDGVDPDLSLRANGLLPKFKA